MQIKKKNEGRALEIEADRLGLKYLNLEVVRVGEGPRLGGDDLRGVTVYLLPVDHLCLANIIAQQLQR